MARFSEVFAQLDAEGYWESNTPCIEDSIEMRARMQGVLHRLAEEWLLRIPDDKVDEFLGVLTFSSREWMKGLPIESAEIVERRKALLADRSEVDALNTVYRPARQVPVALAAPVKSAFPEREKDLTNAAGAVTNRAMPSWSDLKDRVEKLTAQRGAKTVLARRCKVTRQAVSTWLKGKVQPGAEATLRLLDWVTEEEAKQQKRDSTASSSAVPNCFPPRSRFIKTILMPPSQLPGVAGLSLSNNFPTA